MEIKVAVTNLGLYNEGTLAYEWLSLPATEEEISEALEAINIGENYEEIFISDYEAPFTIDQYENLDTLNELAEKISHYDETAQEIALALIEEGFYKVEDIEDALQKAENDCIVYTECATMSDVAYQYYEENGLLAEIEKINPYLANHIDWASIGRDLEIEETFIELESGDTVQVIW